MRTLIFAAALAVLGSVAARAAAPAPAAPPCPELIVTQSLTLAKDAVLSQRLVIRASHITIDGNGATLAGPGRPGDTRSLEGAGIGVLIDGAVNVTVTHLKARGFATGLLARRATAPSILECDFSDNYHNPAHGWGELPPRGGIRFESVRHGVIRQCRASRVWDGLSLDGTDDTLVAQNDFSHCSNTGAHLWRSCRNRFLENDFSYGIRIDRAAGEVHARDSTGVLLETGSDDNYWYRNDITHGGDGIFIRPLNRWVSRGNVFVENDTSDANNNCVESWSPDNTFIRNKACRGSYGFWLGGSDQTVLIGNLAASNGLPAGPHNAPEPGFGHGGIVIVGGPGSHTLIEGNEVHDNNGAGIAFRGDTASQGAAWQSEHWIIQNNRIARNRFGIWGRWGRNFLLAANTFEGNGADLVLTNTTAWTELPADPSSPAPPQALLLGPSILAAGQPARFDASTSADPAGRPLSFQWWIDGPAGSQPVLERRFDTPGFYRLGLTVHNGALAALAWRDLLVVAPVAQELGTEGQAARWGSELENNPNGKGRVHFQDDPDALVGSRSLRFTPDPYPGALATAIYPAARDARWNFSGKHTLCFWIRGQNPNLPGYQNAGPVLELLGPDGRLQLKPARNANRLNDPPFSEARWLWMPVRIPLSGDTNWQAATTGQFALERVDALSVGLDSWGGDPFTIWIDGLSVE